MIKIAICDDQLPICTQLESYLATILKRMCKLYEIDVYYTGKSLCKNLTDTHYDLIFLDIELPDMTGMEVGYYIRETLHNDLVQIAYISAKNRYANSLFDYRPINFLIKPLDEPKVEKILNTYFRITKDNEQLFSYKIGRSYYKVPIENIVYLEHTGRKIRMITTTSEEDFYDSMESLYSTLTPYRFLHIHKSYIINPRHIKEMTYDHVVMTDDKVLPISQSKRKEIRALYTEFIKETFQ